MRHVTATKHEKALRTSDKADVKCTVLKFLHKTLAKLHPDSRFFDFTETQLEARRAPPVNFGRF